MAKKTKPVIDAVVVPAPAGEDKSPPVGGPTPAVEAARVWSDAVLLDTDQVFPDPMNPNKMTKHQFETLVSMIEENGFNEPLQVAPILDAKTEDGRQCYVLIGGEHRLKAAKYLEMKTVPAVILTQYSSDPFRRMEMVRRNVVRGSHDKEALAALVKDIEAHSDADTQLIAERMGYEDEEALLREIRAKEAKEKQEKEENEASEKPPLLDSVAHVVSEIFSKYGDTIPKGWIFFLYKDRLHLMFEMNKPLYSAVQVLAAETKRGSDSLNETLVSAVTEELRKRGVDVKSYEFKPADLKDEFGDTVV